MDTARFLTFCATFFMISLSPGLCMTLSLSLGVSVGVRRALWMMLGELVGVALVGAAALGGVRSEERRVGKECRSRWGAGGEKRNRRSTRH